jgi:hypothetical protein
MNKATEFINRLQNPEDKEYYSKLFGGVAGSFSNPQRESIPEVSAPAAGDGMITDMKSFYNAVNQARKEAGLNPVIPEISDFSEPGIINSMDTLKSEAARLKAGYVF